MGRRRNFEERCLSRISKANKQHASAGLGHAKVSSVQDELSDDVVLLKWLKNCAFHVVFEPLGCEAADVLANKRTRPDCQDGTDELGDHVADIRSTVLTARTAERLARRPTMQYIDFAAILCPINAANIAMLAAEYRPIRMGGSQNCSGAFHDFVTGDMVEPGSIKANIHATATAEK